MSGTKVSAFALKGIFTIGTCWWGLRYKYAHRVDLNKI